jgi:CRP-like cAMP-binding protein
MHAQTSSYHLIDRTVEGLEKVQEPRKVLTEKLREHSRLSNDDIAAIKGLSHTSRELAPDQDLIRQGDRPDVSVLVVKGLMARYHLLPDGRRQYLSFHMTGDLPDAQALFLDHMDHALCALGNAVVALIPHDELLGLFEHRPKIAFAVWRETLIGAAIFREAITNNSARPPLARMAHLFCELFYRAKVSGLTRDAVLDLPIALDQLGDALGMAIATVNRTLAELRTSHAMEFRNGKLTVRNWRRLQEMGQFDPAYLHIREPRQPNI